MNPDNYQFIVVHFDGEDTASEALAEINDLRKEGAIKYKDAVAGYKKNGKVKLQQTKEKKGILGGGVVGLIVGIALGGPILGTALGSLLGGVTHKGMDNKELKQACELLDDDESALFLMVEDADWPKVESELPDYKGFLYREVIPVEVIVGVEQVTDNYETAKALDDELQAEDVK